MITNISIELNDEQRLNIGQKYHNSKAKKMITRKELNHIVEKFIEQIEVQSNIPDDMGIENFAKAIAKMTWEISTIEEKQ
jgi:hypothetical protein|tara:strand:- start:5915 stop:6154 length:240 start_codon:yes stop_codon:yes gene_type:complete